MQEFFTALEQVLCTTDIAQKHRAFLDLCDDFYSHRLAIEHSTPLKHIAPHTNAPIKPAHHIKKAKLDSHNGLAKALHTIAHIEYSAITLSLDSAYRFRYLPREYYIDWLRVAGEEFGHFFLLEGLLNELGAGYGDFAVHSQLYDAMLCTNTSLLYRMGVVHRGLEARGLDANPFVLQKFSTLKHPIRSKIQEVLDIILRDEIGHVSRGDVWWRFALESAQSARSTHANPQATNALQDVLKLMQQDLPHPAWQELDSRLESSFDSEGVFLALCVRFADFILCGKIPNTQARLQCGFSQKEIEKLGRLYELCAKHARA